MSKFSEFYQVLSEEEKLKITKEAAAAFAQFLDSLKIDWKHDTETVDTPMRVAEMYVNDLLRGRFTRKPEARNLQLDDSLKFKILGPIDFKSICIHHCMPFTGYIVIGLNSNAKTTLGVSKYGDICTWYARRGQVQEKLGNDILAELITIHKGAEIAVFIKAHHTCSSHRNEGNCNNNLYTIHTTEKFINYEMFVSSCMNIV